MTLFANNKEYRFVQYPQGNLYLFDHTEGNCSSVYANAFNENDYRLSLFRWLKKVSFK